MPQSSDPASTHLEPVVSRLPSKMAHVFGNEDTHGEDHVSSPALLIYPESSWAEPVNPGLFAFTAPPPTMIPLSLMMVSEGLPEDV